MASAVLASGNEGHWGEREVYTRKYANNSNIPHLNKLNPNPSVTNPNPAPNRQIHDSYGRNVAWQNHEPGSRTAPSVPAVASDNLSPRHRRPSESNGGYLTFDLAAYSRAELKELKSRLRSELEQVRSLRARIENGSFECRSGNHGSRFASSYGSSGDISLVAPQPPPPQMDPALVSPLSTTSKANKNSWAAEIGTAKNKAAPPLSKKVPGRKRALPFVAGRGPKRHASLESPMEKVVKNMMSRCGQILAKLMKHKHGWVFNKPVDVVGLGLHDYYQIIKHPMDLGTVKTRLSKKQYGSPLDFASDVRLTFNNAMIYNPKGQDVYIMAETLLSLFEQMFSTAYKRYEAEHQLVVASQQVNQRVPEPEEVLIEDDVRRSLPLATTAEVPDSMPMQEALLSPQAAQPVPVNAVIDPVSMPVGQATNPVVQLRSTQRLPKPRAKDIDKRPMTFEEKARLGLSLQSLPMENINQMIEIIQRSNSQMAQEGDEIELDIEALDNETLWELDRFVSCHKKAESRMKRQEVINNGALATEIRKIQSPVCEPTPEATATAAAAAAAAAQKSRKVDAGEEDVDIGEEIPINSFPPVLIEKDCAPAKSESSSSGSLSSGSGSSSSSDSDSGSSSGSDSEDSVRSPFVDNIPNGAG